MCTVKEIREAIWEDCHSQHGMEFIEIDRVLQTLPFSQGNDLLDSTNNKENAGIYDSRSSQPLYFAGVIRKI